MLLFQNEQWRTYWITGDGSELTFDLVVKGENFDEQSVLSPAARGNSPKQMRSIRAGRSPRLCIRAFVILVGLCVGRCTFIPVAQFRAACGKTLTLGNCCFRFLASGSDGTTLTDIVRR
jgi:hypothetical protein